MYAAWLLRLLPTLDTTSVGACASKRWHLGNHAFVCCTFGQYIYSGYMPDRPTISRRFLPEEGMPKFEELRDDPDMAFFRTVTARLQTLLGISLIELLSTHSSDEVYLGQRDTVEWTGDFEAATAFERFGKALAEVEERIVERNGQEKLRNPELPCRRFLQRVTI